MDLALLPALGLIRLRPDNCPVVLHYSGSEIFRGLVANFVEGDDRFHFVSAVQHSESDCWMNIAAYDAVGHQTRSEFRIEERSAERPPGHVEQEGPGIQVGQYDVRVSASGSTMTCLTREAAVSEDTYDVVLAWLDQIRPTGPSEPSAELVQLGIAVETFLLAWNNVARELPLEPGDRRIADALAAMANEVVKTHDPPRSVLRPAFEWFGGKLDRFVDEFAAAAGKTAGGVAVIAVGAAVSGHLDDLKKSIAKVLSLL